MKKILPTFIAIAFFSSSFAQVQQMMRIPILHHHGPNASNSIASLLLLYDNDGGVSGINSIPSFQCNYDIIPSVVIENYGNNNLTTATIEYNIDGGNPAFIEWEGSLPPFWTDTIALPQIDVDPGTHTLTIQVTQVNGELDANGLNDNSIQFNIVGASIPAPYSEAFEATQLPQGYFVENADGGSTWTVDETLGFNSQHCMFMPFYTNDVDGDEDDLFMKNVDLSNVADAELSFDVAYAYYSKFYYDELRVSASADCGANWDVIYDKAKDDLATAPFTDLPFVPMPGQWRNEIIDMNSYTGFGDVLIKFEAISGHGNNLFIDNINIGQNLGVEDPQKNFSLNVYPNPANESVTVDLPQNSTSNVEIEIVNAIGQTMIQKTKTTAESTSIIVSSLSPGQYFVLARNEGSILGISPFIITH